MNLEGRTTRLRALEPGDIELMYAWENDTEIWGVSGTLAPFSRHTLERFIEEQQFDIFQTRQQRLIIETPEGLPVGALDLFDLDPVNLRAGVGIRFTAFTPASCHSLLCAPAVSAVAAASQHKRIFFIGYLCF